ncbi:MAG: hypothetical protein ACI9IA_002262, partial [Enterobacterales bacterium]
AQLYWDSMNRNWQSLVVDFDAGSQNEFFSKLGFPDLSIRDLVNTLLVLAFMVMAVTSALFLRQRTKLDKTALSYNKLSQKLKKVGIERGDTEGPVDYIQRVIKERPELEPKLIPILELYLSLRYRESKHRAEQLKQFSKRVNALSISR